MPKKTKDVQYYEGVGRRKTAVARVRLYITKRDKTATVGDKKINQGEFLVNDKPIDKIFSSKYEQKQYLRPLELTDNIGRFSISVKLMGGGKNSQLEAVVHGLSRALSLVDKDTYRPILKKEGSLTRDSRARERRSVGTGGKARRAKQSPKR